MVAAALDGIEGMEASRIELDRGGDSYTADTLAELTARWPGAELVLLIGADVAGELHTWKRVDEVRRARHARGLAAPGRRRSRPRPGLARHARRRPVPRVVEHRVAEPEPSPGVRSTVSCPPPPSA